MAHQSRRSACRTPTRVARGAARPARSSSSPTSRRHRHDALRRTSCCPPPAGARRTARSPIPSGASRASGRSCRARRGAAGLVDHLRRRAPHGLWRAPSPIDDAGRRSFASMPRCRPSRTTGERLFDIGALAGARRRRLRGFRAPPLAGCRRSDAASERLLGDGRFPTPDGRARFVAGRGRRARRLPSTPPIRWRSTPAACATSGTP